ncbi:MAG: glutamine amidotransferase [Actinomycetota bacterium]
MAKVFYIGDWAVSLGPVFAETPFNYSFKGLQTYRYDHYLKDAIESSGEHTCDTCSTWDFYGLPPGRWEEILAEYDVIVFSDVELKNFQLAPQFFDRAVFGSQIITYPDRIRLTVEAVEAGLRVIFMGGWLSFSGEMGKGGWGRSRLAEVLPVECLASEDLVENTEGFGFARTDPSFLQGIEIDGAPPILGYNRTVPRSDATVHVEVAETGDPLVASRKHGAGATLAFTSDPAPHWGVNFVQWEHYRAFWVGALEHLLHLE